MLADSTEDTYSGHLGGTIEGTDETDEHDAAESGHDELVTTLSEVDGDVGGGLIWWFSYVPKDRVC